MNENEELKTTIEKIMNILKSIKNPSTGNSLLEDNGIDEISPVEDDNILITISLLVDKKTKFSLEAALRTEFSKHDLNINKIKLNFTNVIKQNTQQPSQQEVPSPPSLVNVKHIIAVASGKGGVGKSTVSINIAITLAKKGYKTGLIDADIYGPSLGKMLGHPGKVPLQILDEKKIIPMEKFGIKAMSFAFLLDEAQALIWRGPMLGKALEQLLFDVKWGELDYLIIDLPPGTGDTQLSLAQLVSIEGAVIVTTPQDVAVQDAMRAVTMFDQIKLPILGVVENMTEFICPHCGKSSHLFSEGGGKRLADKINSTLLGNIPLSLALMSSGEEGIPAAYEDDKKQENKVIQESHKAVITAYENIVNNIEKLIK
ncbi:MAG: Mrp/NBP35 family ATP-binding protein [Spirochaetia bacterium]|nr:Mrp/NBP35 family ATP-binding protein [Spirochaetia bacterium]